MGSTQLFYVVFVDLLLLMVFVESDYAGFKCGYDCCTILGTAPFCGYGNSDITGDHNCPGAVSEAISVDTYGWGCITGSK